MLAIASLATGFVVAAITPSHGLGGADFEGLNVGDALSGQDFPIAEDGVYVQETHLEQAG